MKLVKYICLLSLVFISLNFQLTAEEQAEKENFGLVIETNGSENENKEEIKPSWKCKDRIESYEKYVLPAKGLSKKAENMLKKHLECWKDDEVMIKLAEIYAARKNYYFAAITYQEAGMTDKYNEMKELQSKYDDDTQKDIFRTKAGNESFQILKKSKSQKSMAITLTTLGPLIAGIGFGLFIHEKAFNGKNSKTAQYSTMLTGLSLIGTGVTLNYFSEYNKNISEAYADISENHYEPGATPKDYYEFSDMEAATRKKMLKTLKIHGATLVSLSIPLFLVSIYSMFEAYDHVTSKDSIFEFRTFIGAILYYLFIRYELVIIAEILTLAPAIASLSGGISMLAHANKWKKQGKGRSVLLLTSISPAIDPITKTYGVNIGFSF